jgi:ubiquinone/menaquinone biosynthesis C-methylase UbiE
MSNSDKVFAGSIPEIYDAHLVPLLFEPYAGALAPRVAAPNPLDVLETAAGTGALTRALAPLLATTARYMVTDLNEPMLQRAAAHQGADARITWRQADAMHLPFGAAAFDAVCCQFGAMFFPDRVAAYREVLRVLRPPGKFHFSVWDRIEENDFGRAVTEAAAAFFPADPPQFLVRAPHGYHDVRRVEADLRAAGFSNISVETVTLRSTAADPRIPALALCQGSPLRNEIEARDPTSLDAVTERAAAAIARAHGAGPVSGKMRAHLVVASF